MCLNLVGEESKYGKEIGGDILEGKRTLMLIHLLNIANNKDKKRIVNYLRNCRGEKTNGTAEWVMDRMKHYKSIDYARDISKNMAGAALKEFYSSFGDVPESKDKALLESIIMYMINREY